MAELKYEEAEDGLYQLWQSSAEKISTQNLAIVKANLTGIISAYTSVRELLKDQVMIAMQIAQQQDELMKNKDFTWAEIVDKAKKPTEEHLGKVNEVLDSLGK